MRVVFVCTGNICRSPMAEALARQRVDGVEFRSAGVHGLDGAPASAGAIEAMAEIGIDLSGHRARSLAGDLAAADRIYVMTSDQWAEVAAVAPWAADRIDLLDPAGSDIADPYGSSIGDYRRARDEIVVAVEARATEWSTAS